MCIPQSLHYLTQKKFKNFRIIIKINWGTSNVKRVTIKAYTGNEILKLQSDACKIKSQFASLLSNAKTMQLCMKC